jgi:hypothetical protein
MSKYPSNELSNRISQYNLYEKIFLGEHFDAFKQISPKEVSQAYSNLRYVACNFGKMMSMLSADMLFEEFPKITYEGKTSDFHDAMMQSNNFHIQLYESGAEQSYFGDVVLRMRAKNGQIILEDVQPHSYDVEVNPMNVRAEPTAHIFQWKVTLPISNGRKNEALFKEIHRKGSIEYELWQLDNGEMSIKLNVGDYFKTDDGKPHPEVVKTNIDDFLVVHIPNYRTNTRIWGISDYKDLINLFFAINNRMTRVDNILDAHGEPILAVPDGVLDDEGKVRREAFGVIEVNNMEAGGQMPQYIVWDAKLESAFDEIDRLVDFLFMFSDMSPSLFGRDKDGQAESGRALKYRLLRTLAKKHRKELYYDANLKRFLTTAQKFALANGLSANGIKMTGKVVEPTIKWQDGIINDALEQIEIEERKLDSGLTTKAESIAVLDGITEDEAQVKLEKVKKEQAENKPTFTASPVFGGSNNDSSGAGENDQQ